MLHEFVLFEPRAGEQGNEDAAHGSVVAGMTGFLDYDCCDVSYREKDVR